MGVSDWFDRDDHPATATPQIGRATACTQLAHDHRDLVIRQIAIDGPQIVEDLADAVAATEPALTCENARIDLRHRHLPALQDAGIVAEVDPGRYGPGEHFGAVRGLQQRIDAWVHGGESA